MLELATDTALLLAIVVLATRSIGERRAMMKLAAHCDTLAATVAALQKDQRAPQRPAGAPPVGAFSFKGAAK